MGKNADGQVEIVLENRQVLIIFFAIVALCGVFFSLGYIVGHNTFNLKTPQIAAAAPESGSKPSPMPHAPEAASAAPAPTPTETSADAQGSQTDLNFYQSVEQKSPEGKLVPAETAAAQTGTTAPGSSAAAVARPAEKSATQSLPLTPLSAQAAPIPPPISIPPQTQQPVTTVNSPTPITDGIMIQVSALTRREDAFTLVNMLKEKKLPVQVLPGTADTLFHVVVGPFKYVKDAEQAKAILEKDGFRPIYKK
jgi:DedD protein